MIRLSKILNEIIPFTQTQNVRTGLEKKYGSGELSAYTFGIEFEFMPSSSTEFDSDKLRVELENNYQVDRDYGGWLLQQRNQSNRRIRDVDSWDDSYGPIDLDTYDSLVSKPERTSYDSYDEYKEELDKYLEQRSEVDVGYERWERLDMDDHRDEYIDELISSGDWEEYIDNVEDVMNQSSMNDDIVETMSYIKHDMNQNVRRGDSDENTWGVGEDGDNVEIRSKHLNQNEFDLVRDICKFVSQQNVSGGTSAHVHIGLPADFDVYDLLAISTLVDEKAIKNQVGPDRLLGTWAKLRDSLHNNIVNLLLKSSANQNTSEKSFVLNNDQLYKLLTGISGRYWGTNITSMFSKKTIEFRYLSSEIAKNPETFIKWIQYYLILPKIAKSRNSIVLKQSIGSDSQTVTAVREAGGVKFTLNSKSSTPNLPASSLKTGDVPSVGGKFIQAKRDKIAKIQI